jgi:hypothetical protein
MGVPAPGADSPDEATKFCLAQLHLALDQAPQRLVPRND